MTAEPMTPTNGAESGEEGAGLPPRRVLVVDRARALQQWVAEAYPGLQRPEVHHLWRTTRLLEAVEAGGYDAVVAGPSQVSRAALGRLRELRRRAPELGIVLALNGDEPADVHAFFDARPDELVRVPTDAQTLRAAVDAAATAREVRAHPPEPVAPTPVRRGRVVAVTGPAGGTGKTTVSLALASLLASAGRQVVLTDGDLQFGSVAPALALAQPPTVAEIAFERDGRLLDPVTLDESLAAGLTAASHGFSVLPAPSDPADADAIGPDELEGVVAALRERAEDVVVDLPPGLDARNLTMLDVADHVLVVASVEVAGAVKLRSFLDTLDRLEIDAVRRTVVLNEELDGTGVGARDIAEVLGEAVAAVPFDVAVRAARNAGRPPAVGGDTAAGRALAAALTGLLPEGATVPGRAGWRARLRAALTGRRAGRAPAPASEAAVRFGPDVAGSAPQAKGAPAGPGGSGSGGFEAAVRSGPDVAGSAPQAKGAPAGQRAPAGGSAS